MYDGTAKIGSLDSAPFRGPCSIEYGCQYVTGLTVVTTGNIDATIIHT